MNAPATATIDNSGKYGWQRFPHGKCANDNCENAACHHFESQRVCRQHLPSKVVFCPFLGQQTKLWNASDRYVLGGGGAGGAKTYVGSRLWIKQWVHAQQHWRETGERSKGWAVFFRRIVPELLQVVNEFRMYFEQVDGAARWIEQYKLAQFPNGYTVQFGGMENAKDWQKYWGPQYTLAVFDEATQFTVEQLEKIDQRIRTDDPALSGREQLYLLTNPIGAETKQYLKRRFVKAAPPETRVALQQKLEDGRVVTKTQVYIPSNLFDNPALVASGEYEATLRRHSNNTIRALLYNDWDVDEGSWIGADWDPGVHLCRPFTIPRGWSRFKMADYGFRARSSVMWCAVDPDDNWVIYRSFSATGLTAEDLGRRVKEIELQRLVIRVGTERITVTEPEWDEFSDCSTVMGPMDRDLWSKQGETGPSRGETLQMVGTGFYRSNKDPDSAAEQIRARLRRRMVINASGATVAGLRFFTTCKTRYQTAGGDWDETGPIITIPNIPFDSANPDRWNTDGDDHDLDALGYGALSRPLAGTAEEPLPPGQGVVYELLRFKQAQTNQSPLPNWYSNG